MAYTLPARLSPHEGLELRPHLAGLRAGRLVAMAQLAREAVAPREQQPARRHGSAVILPA